MNMFEIKMKASEQSLWEELGADTEERMRTEVNGVFKKMDSILKKIREEIMEEVEEEVIPRCVVVKEIRGESINYNYSLLISRNNIHSICISYDTSARNVAGLHV